MGIQYVLNGAAAGSLCALCAVAMAVVYRTAGFLDFAQAGILALGAYATYVCISWGGVPILGAIAGGIVVTAALGAAYYAALIEPLRAGRASAPAFMLNGLGVLIFVDSSLAIAFGAEARALPGLSGSEVKQVFGGSLTRVQVFSIAAAWIVIGLWAVVYRMTRLGLVWRAVSNSVELSSVVGVDVRKAIGVALICACATSGLAGALQACDTGLAPSMGFGVYMVALVAVVLGGKSVVGCSMAAVLLGILQQTVVMVVPTFWQDAAVFVVLIAFLVLRPRFVRRDRDRSEGASWII